MPRGLVVLFLIVWGRPGITAAQQERLDSATAVQEAQRLALRADSLGRGSSSDRRSAVELWRQAAYLFHNAAAGHQEGMTLGALGSGFMGMQQPDSALAAFRLALPLLRTAGDQIEAGRALYNIGVLLGNFGQADSALAYFQMALPRFSDPARRGSTLVSMGLALDRLGHPDSALEMFHGAIPLLRAAGDNARLATAILGIGNLFATVGPPDSALFYYRNALALQSGPANDASRGQTLNLIGTVFGDVGRPDSAVAYLQQALLLLRAGSNPAPVASTLHNIGIMFANAGELDSALTYYRETLPLRRAAGDKNREGMTLDAIASVLADLGQPDSALAYYRAALPLRASEPGSRAATLQNIGTVFQDVGAPDSALAYFRRALSIQHQIRDRTSEALTLGAIGVSFSRMNRADSALRYHRRALAIQEGLENRSRVAGSLHNIAGAFRRSGRLDSALAYERKSLPIRQEVKDLAGESRTLLGIGSAYASARRLDSAVAYLDRAAALVTSVSQRSGGDFNRLSFNETTSDYFDLWALAWLDRAGARESGNRIDSSEAAYAALAASERGRARALLDLMRDSTRTAPGADVRTEGARLAGSVSQTGSAGLVYWTTPDTLVTWVIASGKVAVYRTKIARTALASLVGGFRLGLGSEEARARLGLRSSALEESSASASPPATGWSRRAELLSAVLLPPRVLQLLAGEHEVVIVPQGSLALVPFAALPVGTTRALLGTVLAIRYAPSLTTLQQFETTPPSTAEFDRRVSTAALVVGNPTMPTITTSSGRRSALAPLSGAEAESRAVAAQLGAVALTGDQATEAEVVRRITDAPLVHLATHGFAYSAAGKARSSFIALAPDSAHDGLLTVGKLLDDPALKLKADLVVLSACQTGLGNLRQAEGTVGLQRAFLAKGARSVLVSLWNVSDAATQQLMTGFYQHWLSDADHPSKAEALRRAQNAVRGTPGFEHPRYWAAFQLVGAR